MRSSLRFGSASWVIGLAGLTAPALVAPAAAQVSDVQPYFVVVTGDNLMRADAGSIYYAVRRLKAGEVLRVDGETRGWLRVEYLPGTQAYVPAAEADAAGGAVKLKSASKLMAVDAVNGVRPWWPLLSAPLPAGTAFASAEPVKTSDGAIDGYLVPAPARARGFVAQSAVRRATTAEAATYTGATAPAGAPAATGAGASTPAPRPTVTIDPARGTPADAPKPPEVATPAPAGGTSTTTTSTTPDPTSPTGTRTTSTTQTTTPPPGFEVVEGTGRTTVTRETSTEPVPGATTPAATPATPAEPAVARDASGVPITQRVSDINTLRSIFDRGMRGESPADVEEAIREFQASLAALSSADANLVNELNKRLEALRLRRDLFSARATASALTTQIDERRRSMTTALAEVQQQAVYTIVGTMLPSNVYDGSRGLPLMYRVDAPDTYSTRTVAYVVPRDGIDLITKTGKVVGIIGESKLDPALGVTIVSPSRVDVLNFVEGRYRIESSESVERSTTTTETRTE